METQTMYLEIEVATTLKEIAKLATLMDLSDQLAANGYETARVDADATKLAEKIGRQIAQKKDRNGWQWDIEYYAKEQEREQE